MQPEGIVVLSSVGVQAKSRASPGMQLVVATSIGHREHTESTSVQKQPIRVNYVQGQQSTSLVIQADGLS